MNLLYIHTHDMGRFNGIYSRINVTPHMEAFAREACVFQNAHCAAPSCSPSRGALLTGMLPHSNGLIGLSHRGFSLRNPKQHLSHFLKDHGYHTVLCGIQHETADVTTLGYDETHTQTDNDISQHRDDYAVEHALAFLEHAKSPFFMSVGFGRPHRPYDEYDAILPDGQTIPGCLPNVKEIREDFADYLTTLQKADSAIGRVLDAVKKNGLFEDTMIILTTDHGIAFPFMKNTLYDTGTGVTLAIRIPGTTTARRTDALVSQIDVFPTICEALQLPKPDYLQGRSLLPVLTGETDWIQDEIYAQMNFHAMYEPARCIRTQRYKYICRFEDTAYCKTQNVDGGKAKDFLLRNGFAEQKVEQEAFYDLYFDPNERRNLLHTPEYRDICETLKTKLHEQMVKTNDPLLDGPLMPPAGAVLKGL